MSVKKNIAEKNHDAGSRESAAMANVIENDEKEDHVMSMSRNVISCQRTMMMMKKNVNLQDKQ
jgi:hypothetical protein